MAHEKKSSMKDVVDQKVCTKTSSRIPHSSCDLFLVQYQKAYEIIPHLSLIITSLSSVIDIFEYA